VLIIEAAYDGPGVTCGDVIDGINDFLHVRMTKKEFDGVDIQRRKDITTAYHINRSAEYGVPGDLLGEGIRRLDWLYKKTVYGGLKLNSNFVQAHYSGLPATIELFCEERKPLTPQDIRDHQTLEQALERERVAEIARVASSELKIGAYGGRYIELHE
jgi:hypothetical protein